MSTESNDSKEKTIKDIYNDSVKLLELLNVLIPKVDTYKPKLDKTLIQEIADKCFELGANLATNVETLEGNEEEDLGEYAYGM